MTDRPKIVALDARTLDPGDPNWQGFEALGEVTLHDRSAPAEIVPRTREAPVILVNKVRITANVMDACPPLRYVGILATGTNNVDLPAARSRGITVTNVPGYSTDSVAQHAIALLLELASGVGDHDRVVHDGAWARCPDFAFTVRPLVELAGKTLGIVGVGAIGKRVARIAHALGMNIAAAHQSSMKDVSIHGVPILWMTVDELFTRCDAITLHCPLTDATRHLVSARRLAGMKKTAYLINTGRGPLVDEAALAEALRGGGLAGAGLDVLSLEPPDESNPLLSAPRCVITPHVAWASREAKARLMRQASENLRAFLAGSPVNVVNA